MGPSMLIKAVRGPNATNTRDKHSGIFTARRNELKSNKDTPTSRDMLVNNMIKKLSQYLTSISPVVEIKRAAASLLFSLSHLMFVGSLLAHR